jgi:hypothetical protein
MPRFGRVANPQKVEKISEKNMKNVTKISWQPWQTKELADSLANVDCIGYINLFHRLPFYHWVQILCQSIF